MRRQCYAAQVTAPLHHQIFTNDSKQAVETRSELVRASQTPLQGMQQLRGISVRVKCKNGNKAGRKASRKSERRLTPELLELWVQSLLIFHLHCQQGNNDPCCLFFWPQKTTPPSWEQNSSLKTIPITKSLFPSPYTSDQYKAGGWDGEQDGAIIAFCISGNWRNSQDLFMVSNNHGDP